MKMNQVERLMSTVCPRDDLTRQGYSGTWPTHPKHHLMKVTTRRLRNGFRRRVWWECDSCDLREEVDNGFPRSC